MKQIDSKTLKEIDVATMTDIDRVCKKHNINYTMIGGTLIGAIRHKGFIPWDGDIDIAMKRCDYEKFIDIYSKEKGENYRILNNKLNPEYYYQFSRVVDTRTEVEEFAMKPINGLGIFIDVFPIDNINSKFIKLKLAVISFFVKGLAFKTTKCTHNGKSKIKNIIKSLIYNKNYQYYFDKVQEYSQKENNKKCDKAGVLVCGTGEKDIFYKELFDEYTYLTFEDKEFMAIKDYEYFLKHRFGDYMKLPPKEEQVDHHTMSAYWKRGK